MVNLESHVALALGAVLAPLPPGAAIPNSDRFGDLQLALERFIPQLLGPHAESLDGFRFCVARKSGPRGAELIGLALLIADQTWTPVWLRLRLSDQDESLAAIDCRLGERGDGAGGLRRTPYHSDDVTKQLSSLPMRITDLAWAHEAKRGDVADTAAHQREVAPTMSAPKYTRPENERRFLVDEERAAALEGRPGWLIEDRYLTSGLLRLRRITDEESGARTFKLAKKFPSTSAYTRPLVNIYLDEAEHAALSALDGVELRKRRIHVDEQGHPFGVDFFASPLTGLVLCEVETATLEEVMALRPPSWAPIEVTADPFFSGGALCRAGGDELAERLHALRAQAR